VVAGLFNRQTIGVMPDTTTVMISYALAELVARLAYARRSTVSSDRLEAVLCLLS
jgi:hypothetical protein